MRNFIKRNWILLSFASVILSLFFFMSRKSLIGSTEDFQMVQENNEPNDEPIKRDEVIEENVFVDVKGAVHAPGVYEVELGVRVVDVIELAGGFTEEADELAVNLAQQVQDEMVIYTPSLGEEGEVDGIQGTTEKIRINYATKEELETLPGIGPAKAEAILQYLEEQGSFQKKEDLLQVSGIGEKVFTQLKDEIQVP